MTQISVTPPADPVASRWTSPALVSDWGGHRNCGSRHAEAYDGDVPRTDAKSKAVLSTHDARYIGELVDTETGEVVRQHLCSNAAAAFAHRWGLQFPVVGL